MIIGLSINSHCEQDPHVLCSSYLSHSSLTSAQSIVLSKLYSSSTVKRTFIIDCNMDLPKSGYHNVSFSKSVCNVKCSPNAQILRNQSASFESYVISQNMVPSPADSRLCLLNTEIPRPDSGLIEKEGLELGPEQLIPSNPGNHLSVRTTGLVYTYYSGSFKWGTNK